MTSSVDVADGLDLDTVDIEEIQYVSPTLEPDTDEAHADRLHCGSTEQIVGSGPQARAGRPVHAVIATTKHTTDGGQAEPGGTDLQKVAAIEVVRHGLFFPLAGADVF